MAGTTKNTVTGAGGSALDRTQSVTGTHLGRANFVEDNEGGRLREPCEDEVRATLDEEGTRAEGEDQLRHEAREWRPD
jgi:hypothetical protein